jgi:hypothetical protein
MDKLDYIDEHQNYIGQGKKIKIHVAQFFFWNEAKALPFRLIKKKRVAQLINRKPG